MTDPSQPGLRDTRDELSDLTSGEAFVVGGAALLSLGGTLIGLAGLLMWGIKAFDSLAPQGGEAPLFVESFAPYLTVFNFALTLLITACGLLNLMQALRWQEFLGGGWRRWLGLSAVSLLAGAAFVLAPALLGPG